MNLSTVHIVLYFLLFVFSHHAADYKKTFKQLSLLPLELQILLMPGYVPRITYTHVHKEIHQAKNENETGYPFLPSSLGGNLVPLKDTFNDSNQNTYLANGVHYVDYNIPKLIIRSDLKDESLYVNTFFEGRHYHEQCIKKGSYCLFDGYNKNEAGIIVRSKDFKTRVQMISKKMCRGYDHRDRNTAQLDQICYSLALHEDVDRVILCTEEPSYADSSTLGLYEFRYNHYNPADEKTQLTMCASAKIPFKCQKIAHLDQQMYVAVTDKGDFKIIEHIDKTFKIYNQRHSNIRFKNIAVNKDHTNLSQGKFRCALLADTGALYIVDLWHLKQPTLLHAYTIPDINLVHNIYYKDDELRIVYRDAEDMQLITKMNVYKDMYHFLWLRTFMKQYQDEIVALSQS